MEATLLEWLNLVARWIHVIAAIMWIGDSFLFMFLDRSLHAPTKPREGEVVGEMWMVHSGGFYEVVKRKSLRPEEMPATLHWFKWESYTTWLSGFFLLVVVYYLGSGVQLVDPSVLDIGHGAAVALSLGLLVLAVVLYDLVWRTLGQSKPTVALGLSYALFVLGILGVTRLFPGRAAYLQVGAMLATVMASNVFFRIIPAQRHMLAQTAAGQPVDTSYGTRAKQRSTHNHYVTLPVLITMLSNHFPSTYGHAHPDLVLLLLVATGMSLKYTMNFRFDRGPAIPAIGAVSALAVLFLVAPASTGNAMAAYEAHAKVPYARVHEILTNRCISCHAEKPANPAFPAPPNGVVLDTPARVAAQKDRVFARAVLTKTMPLGNMTGMTAEERDEVGAWIAQGASIEGFDPAAAAAAPVAAPVAPPAPVEAPAGTDPAAHALFQTRCMLCHGPTGHGDGPAAGGLNPKPRNFSDKEWQASVTDEHLKTVIAKGGAAAGKSPLMAANPDLDADQAKLDAVVAYVRALGK